MEGVALHTFEQTSPDELSFNSGDKLIIFDYGTKNEWYEAELEGRRGHVPGNYIKVIKPSWWAGNVSRVEAEKLLSNHDMHEGAFLVRVSESCPNEYSLSVRCNNAVQHFRILKDKEYKYFLWQTSFRTLKDLVEHYKGNESVSRTQEIFLRDMDTRETPCHVQAIYDFPASDNEHLEDNELSFKAGDIIQLLKSEDENWWAGRLGEREGYFPKSYVKLYNPPNGLQ